MKSLKKLTAFLLVFVMVACILPFSASAALIFPDGDFHYTINGSNNTATIVEYTGTDENVTIPSEYSGYPVVKIAEDAFSNNSTMKTVSIPASITYIDNYAFYNCTALTKVSVPSTVTKMGTSVFNGCTALSYAEFNASVTSIPQNTFYNCTSLSEVNIDSAVTEIGNAVFFNCGKLKSLTTANITSFGQRAFYNSGIVSITVNERVTNIPVYAFSGCSDLEKIIFYNKDTVIDDTALDESNAALTIYGYTDSTAQQYATDFIYDFVALDSVLGDADKNGYISISDVTAIQKHCAKILDLDASNTIYADTNGDGKVTVRDATRIQLFLAKYVDFI